MNGEKFNSFVEDTFDLLRTTLTTKGYDYDVDAAREDKLLSFKNTAEQMQVMPDKVVGILLGKHINTLFTYIAEGKYPNNPAVWDERILDSINYLIFLRALKYSVGGEVGERDTHELT